MGKPIKVTQVHIGKKLAGQVANGDSLTQFSLKAYHDLIQKAEGLGAGNMAANDV